MARRWIGRDVSHDRSCIISEDAKLFGRIELGERVRIEPNSVVYGPAKIGLGSFIAPNAVLGFPQKAELMASITQRRPIHNVPDRKELTIGQDCIVRSGTCIYSGTSVGDSVSFGHNVMIRENVQIGSHTLIGTGVVIDGSCEIGENVSIQTGGYVPTNSRIGDFVFLGPHVVLTNDKYVTQKKTELVGPTIHRGATIGANSLLMPSIEVGEGAMIGAHSLVLDNVPPRCICAGVPAKKMKDVPSDWRTSLLKI